MRYYGKLIGAVLGWILLKHPVGAVLGIVIGHLFDVGWTARPGSSALDRHYATLGLTADASDAELELSFRRLISQYHPDKVAGAAQEIRTIAEQRAQAINTAYEAIQRARRSRA